MLDADFDPKEYVRDQHPAPKHIDILGKYYYPRGGGTPDHSVKIWVDHQLVYTSPILCTGGQNQYLETAGEWLEKNMVIPVRPQQRHGGNPPIWSWCRDRGIEIGYGSEDVRNKRQLLV
jgi:hypothetical protein